MDELAQNQEAIEKIISGIDGFVSYTLLRTEDGGITLSVYRDRAGAEASTRQAQAWTQANISPAAQSAAEVRQGEVILHLDKGDESNSPILPLQETGG
jgi:heme-degrading monooxygenase HmoA